MNVFDRRVYVELSREEESAAMQHKVVANVRTQVHHNKVAVQYMTECGKRMSFGMNAFLIPLGLVNEHAVSKCEGCYEAT